MAEHRQVAKTVLETIRATPTTTKAQAEALIDSAFPGNGQKYLGWYLTWWYKYGITNADTYTALKNRIAAMDDTQFGYAKGRMARLAETLIEIRLQKDAIDQQIQIISGSMVEYTPKTEPDQETLDHWNATNPFMADYYLQTLQLQALQEQSEQLAEDV